jgi:hypothetical protein
MSTATDPLTKQFLTLTACGVAGVNPITLSSWRSRFGFFSEARSSQGKATYFSLIDVCKMRAAVVMIESALAPYDAVTFAQNHLGGPLFALILRHQGVLAADTALTRFVGFERGGGKPGERALVAEDGKDPREWRVADADELPPARATLHLLTNTRSVVDTMSDTGGTLTIIDLEPVVAHVLDALKDS